MKYLILSFALVSCFNDSEAIKNAEKTGAGGFMEENSMCICTKEYKPVCANDGKTYPSACQAGCAKVEVVAEGACPK